MRDDVYGIGRGGYFGKVIEATMTKLAVAQRTSTKRIVFCGSSIKHGWSNEWIKKAIEKVIVNWIVHILVRSPKAKNGCGAKADVRHLLRSLCVDERNLVWPIEVKLFTVSSVSSAFRLLLFDSRMSRCSIKIERTSVKLNRNGSICGCKTKIDFDATWFAVFSFLYFFFSFLFLLSLNRSHHTRFEIGQQIELLNWPSRRQVLIQRFSYNLKLSIWSGDCLSCLSK